MSSPELSLRAVCEECGSEVQVGEDELLAFDCTCGVCGGVLVIQEAEAPGNLDPPTRHDAGHDRPTRADADTDPYALAARALFGAVLGGSDRPTRGDAEAAEPPTGRYDDPREGTGALSTQQWVGALDGRDPGPVWDGSGTRAMEARRAAAPPPPALELPGLGVVEVSPDRDTVGRASRSYDRYEVAPAAPLAPAAPGGLLDGLLPNGQLDLGARADAPHRPAAESPAPAPARPAAASPADPRPRPAAPPPSPAPPPTALPSASAALPRDLDWLALLDDDGLPEAAGAPGARVRVELPASAAPGTDSEADKIHRLQDTLERVERGEPLSAQALLGPPAAEPRPAQRYPQPAAQAAGAGDPAPSVGAEAPRRREAEVAPQAERTQPEPPGARTGPGLGEPDPREFGAGSQILRGSGLIQPVRPEAGKRLDDGLRRDSFDQRLVCARDRSSPAADAFRLLYQRIFHSRNGSSPRVVLVTSPRRGEGKTTVAANLAIVAARVPGSGALLVDADPRGEGVMRAFGQGPSEGLLEAIRSAKDPMHYVVRFGGMRRLDVLPLGIRGSETAELIASDRTAEVLSALQASYGGAAVLIVDGAAVLESGDAAALARCVDGVVLVVRAGRTSRTDVELALDHLGRERVLGVVLNDSA